MFSTSLNITAVFCTAVMLETCPAARRCASSACASRPVAGLEISREVIPADDACSSAGTQCLVLSSTALPLCDRGFCSHLEVCNQGGRREAMIRVEVLKDWPRDRNKYVDFVYSRGSAFD